MANKTKLTKKAEDQIQSLASDIYIQIEETLVGLINDAAPTKEITNKDIEQEPTYIALLNSHKASQKELLDLVANNQNLTHQLSLLENENTVLKTQLADEKNKTENIDSQKTIESWQKKHEVQLGVNSELKQKITDINEKLKTSKHNSEQNEESYNHQINITKQDFDQKIKQLNAKLKQSQLDSTIQQKSIIEHREKITFLEEQVQQHVKSSQKYKQALNQKNEQYIKLQAQQTLEQQNSIAKDKQHKKDQIELQLQLTKLEKNHEELLDKLITEQSGFKRSQKEIEGLNSQVKLAQEGQENLLKRFNANREKQEKENDQVRDTIKNLRDENNELNTKNDESKAKYLEQIHELESKLTEYRLKFEYAQKQLSQQIDKSQ